MKSTLALAILALTLACSAFAFVHYQRKHEDDVAYFALKSIHEQAEKTDCKAVADAAYKEHCLSTKAEMKTWLNERPLSNTDDLLRENMNCLTRNFDRWNDEHNACYRQKDAEQIEDLRTWEEKYPRQTANMKRDALENARKQDAEQAVKQGKP